MRLNENKIPLIVAVSGHRDILDDDFGFIREEVFQELTKIQSLAKDQKKNNIVPLILLSGLAQGSDQLVAEVALELGWDVIAVLPMPKQEYVKDFLDLNSRQQFEKLYEQCCRTIELPFHTSSLDPDIKNARDQQYRNQGIFITRQAQLVLALWDGKPLDRDGECGTSYVVDLCRNGPPPAEGELLVSPETTSLIQIPVRRIGAPDQTPKPAQHVAADSVYKKVIKEFGAFNSSKLNEDELSESRSYLFASRNIPLDEGGAILADAFCKADVLSMKNQKLRALTIQIATVAIALGVLSESIFNLSQSKQWLILYGGFLTLAYGLYYCLFRWDRVRVEARYIEYRVLAEGLRVQIFWRIAGIKKNVADHYLQLIKTEVGWVREAVRNIAFLAELTPMTSANLAEVKNVWITGQEAYFIGGESEAGVEGKARQHRVKHMFFDHLSTVTFIVGCTFFALTSLTYVYTLDVQIKSIASAFSAYFFLLAGLLKGYSSVMGYDEQSTRYEKCGRLFSYAKKAIENKRNNPYECLFVLGKQALEENADWFMQHRRNSFQIKS